MEDLRAASSCVQLRAAEWHKAAQLEGICVGGVVVKLVGGLGPTTVYGLAL